MTPTVSRDDVQHDGLRRQLELQTMLLRLDERPGGLDRGTDHRIEIDPFNFEVETPAGDARDLEQIIDRVEGNNLSTFERNLSSQASRAIARDLPNLSLLLLEVENDHSGKRCNQNPTPDHYVAHCVLLKDHRQRAASPRWLFCVGNYTLTDPIIPILDCYGEPSNCVVELLRTWVYASAT
jgi:hypothetical protein